MDKASIGQVTSNAAEIYEEFFIPALFSHWAHKVADSAQIVQGQRIFDVACGTGILARTIAERVGTADTVVGLDINDGMLSVARSKNPAIEWRHGSAEALPFNDNSFDVVVSQFGLMFFADKKQAIAEMIRVLKPNGRLVVAVWDTLENTVGYADMVALLERLFGAETANSLRAPYILGDKDTFKALFEHPQLKQVSVETHMGTAHFPSIEQWVYTDVKGWVMSDDIDEAQFTQLVDAAQSELIEYVQADGTVAFNAPAHILSAIKTVS